MAQRVILAKQTHLTKVLTPLEDRQLDTLNTLDAAAALDDKVHLFGEGTGTNDKLVARNDLQLELLDDGLHRAGTRVFRESLPVEDETGEDVLADVVSQRLRQVLHDLPFVETSEVLPEDRVIVVDALNQL